MLKFFKNLFFILSAVLIIGYAIPIYISSPIAEYNITKIDSETFWYYPWGDFGVHKGIDIFCRKKTNVLAPVSGFVIGKGYGSISGNYIYILGSKWRTYYFAHLDTVEVTLANFVSRGDVIGKTGNTGNATYAPTHLHFSIKTIVPYVWLYDNQDIEGWKKMFYLNPLKELHFKNNVIK